jgi:putative flippase GtrA
LALLAALAVNSFCVVTYSGGQMLLRRLHSSDELRTFARFLVVGVLNSAFGYLAFAVLLFWLPRPVALLCSHLLGVAFNFHSTAIGVFNQYRYRLVGRFVIAYAVVYLFNLGLLEALCRVGQLPDLAAQAIAVPFSALFSFVLLRAFVFQGRSRQAAR